MRKLAEQSAEAAGSTSEIVNDITRMTERVAALAGEGAPRTETSARTVALSRGEFEGIAASAREVAARVTRSPAPAATPRSTPRTAAGA